MTIQKYSSAKTSINKNKLPSSTKKIQWELYRGLKVLDFGGGKYNNLKDFLKATYNIDLFIYDKFNRSIEENELAINCKPDMIVCNNVLNVIDSIEVIQDIVNFIQGFNVPYCVSVYTGNNSNIGSITGKDTYQRNEKTKEYLKYFKNAKLYKNMILTV